MTLMIWMAGLQVIQALIPRMYHVEGAACGAAVQGQGILELQKPAEPVGFPQGVNGAATMGTQLRIAHQDSNR